MKKFILSFTCFIVSLFLFVPMDVKAYTSQDNFYPLVTQTAVLQFFNNSGEPLNYFASPDSINVFHFSNPTVSEITHIVFYPGATATVPDQPFNFPADFNLYDYYLLGALYSNTKDVSLSTFKPTFIRVRYKDANTDTHFDYNLSDLNIYNTDNVNSLGFGFSVKVDFAAADNNAISNIYFTNDINGTGSKPANLMAEFGILAVEKGSSNDQINQQIVNKLEQINSNINSTNSTINNATNNIIGSMQESVDNVTNGYTGEVVDQANNVFNNAAADLNSIESDLVAITDQKILDYTTTAFDSNIITDLGGSFLYVVTWFNNFWDIGGLFTQLLYTALALFVAFFILKGGFS